MDKICPIWLDNCHFACPSRGTFEGGVCDCVRAGGKFECASPEQLLSGLTDEEKILLSGWIAHENFPRASTPLVDQDSLQMAISRPMPSVHERIDLALRWLVISSNGRIGIRPLDYDDLQENILSQKLRKAFRLMAFSYCHANDWSGVLLLLEQEGFVEIPTMTTFKRDQATKSTVPAPQKNFSGLLVTSKGFSHNARKTVDTSRAFVAMWFGGNDGERRDMDAVYDKAIAPAIRDAGYDPVRVDREEHLGKIDDEIIAQIRRARFVVADFTAAAPKEPRGGVYYEAGFAYGLGREVVYTCRADFVGALHFDTRQFNHIVWNADQLPDFRKALRNRIERAIGVGPKKPPNDQDK